MLMRIEELIIALTTVVIRYHDSQGTNVLVSITEPHENYLQSQNKAMEILADTNYEKNITRLISECTKNYSDRLPLLNFIKSQIILLKSQVKKNTPYSINDMVRYQNAITQLFIDFRELLKITKSATYSAQFDNLNHEPQMIVPLKGLVDSGIGIFGTSLCHSGVLVEGLFAKFAQSKHSTDSEFTELALAICTEHQKNIELNEKEAKIEQYENSMSILSTTLKEKDDKLKLISDELEQIKKRESTQQKTIAELQAELQQKISAPTTPSPTELQLKDISAKLALSEEKALAQQKIIEELQKKLEQVKKYSHLKPEELEALFKTKPEAYSASAQLPANSSLLLKGITPKPGQPGFIIGFGLKGSSAFFPNVQPQSNLSSQPSQKTLTQPGSTGSTNPGFVF